MVLVLTKKLSQSEKVRHYLIVPPSSRCQFPKAGDSIKVLVKGKRMKVEIDHYNRLHLGAMILNKFNVHKWGEYTVFIHRNPDGTYTISVNQSKRS